MIKIIPTSDLTNIDRLNKYGELPCYITNISNPILRKLIENYTESLNKIKDLEKNSLIDEYTINALKNELESLQSDCDDQ